MRKNTLRFHVAAVSLFLGSCIFTVILLEILVRLFSPQILVRTEGLFIPDPCRSFKLAPGFRGFEVSSEFSFPVIINSRGLRDREFETPKGPGVFRILVLGDSFTYGSGAEAGTTYPRLLEDLLNRDRIKTRFEVINAGVSGYGTFHEKDFLVREGVGYAPDLLILQFYPDNDLFENLHPFRLEVQDDFLGKRSKQGPMRLWIRTLKNWLRSHSHAYRLLGDRWHLLRIRLGMEGGFSAFSDIYLKEGTRTARSAWQKTAGLLSDIHGFAKEHGIGFLMVFTPKNITLDGKMWKDYLAFHMADPSAVDRDIPRQTLRAFCSSEGIPLLDLTEHFGEMENPLDCYWPKNGHWNSRGHRLVATWLYEFLKGEGMIQ